MVHVRKQTRLFFHPVQIAEAFVATKQGAIVGGQTSCKTPEIAAFEKHLPQDVEVVSCHSLHGPKIDPKGQPLVRYSFSFFHTWAYPSGNR